MAQNNDEDTDNKGDGGESIWGAGRRAKGAFKGAFSGTTGSGDSLFNKVVFELGTFIVSLSSCLAAAK